MNTFEYEEKDITVNTACISNTPGDILYFDIETTGLSANRSDLYLIGFGYIHKGQFYTRFLFNDDGKSEPEMLNEFAKYISKYKYIISYNGDTFDIPYMQTKMKLFDIDCCFDNIISVDIYKTTRKYKKLFNLSSMKQIDVENLVGFKRNIFISGGKLINTYKEYRSSGSEMLLNDLMTHNHDDVRGLISITAFLNIPSACTQLDISEIKVTENSLDFICNIPSLPCRITFAAPDIRINAVGNLLNVSVPVVQKIMRFYFKDYRNYYYLPVEGMAIHKSMAEYVDSSHKERATKDTAFTPVNDTFIPAPPFEKANLFYDGGLNGQKFIRLSNEMYENKELSTSYIQKMIKPVFAP